MNCNAKKLEHPSRRSFVQAGLLGLGGLSLSQMLQLRVQGASRKSSQGLPLEVLR